MDHRHDEAFFNLKSVLTQAPILTYPDFSAIAPPFVLQTDASAIGLGAVLEQGAICDSLRHPHTK